MLRPAPLAGLTAVLVLAIEWGRLSGVAVPIPFLMLYATVVLSAGGAGALAGGLSGAVAAAYVLYAASAGFGPRTLTGGAIQVIFGSLLYVATGYLLGRVRDQRDTLLRDVRRHEAELESKILARTLDLQEKEAALRASETSVRAIVDNVADGIVTIEEDGRIESVNPVACAIFGYAADELVGRNVSLLMPESDRGSGAGQAEDFLRGSAGEALGQERRLVEARRKDGSVIPAGIGVGETIVRGRRLFIASIRDVTKRVEAERALRESEARFRAVVNNSPTKIHIKDADGRYILVNRVAERLFGVTDEDARGRTTADIFPADVAAQFVDHDRAVMESGQFVEQEEEWAEEDGVHTYLTVKFPIMDADGRVTGVGAIGTDITERKLAEEALRTSEARLRAFMENSPSAILIKDTEGRFILANKCWNDWFNPSGDEIAGKTVFDVCPEDHAREVTRAEDEILRTGQRVEMEIETPFADGTRCITLLQKFPIFDESGAIRGIAGINTDITERKRFEAALTAAKEQAELANRTKSEFLANMSHELRTPLNAIIGFSEAIQRQTFGPVGSSKYIEYVEDINHAGTHLLSIINDILDLSKIEAGKLELREREVDIAGIVGSCLLLMKHRAEEGGVTLTADLADGLSPLYADERMIKQILFNLLSNAIKFTPAGGEVTLGARHDPGTGYVLEVRDSGIGIATENIATALAPFKQVDGDLNRKFEGTGLGLSLSKSLAELHGGSLDLHSEVGVGTTVTVRFPAARIAAAAATGT